MNIRSRDTGFLALLIVGLVLFLLFTSPYELPLFMLIVPFILLALILFKLSKMILMLLSVSGKKSKFISGAITSLVMLVILLQSIRQLSINDFLIVTALFVGLIFYMRRIDL